VHGWRTGQVFIAIMDAFEQIHVYHRAGVNGPQMANGVTSSQPAGVFVFKLEHAVEIAAAVKVVVVSVNRDCVSDFPRKPCRGRQSACYFDCLGYCVFFQVIIQNKFSSA